MCMYVRAGTQPNGKWNIGINLESAEEEEAKTKTSLVSLVSILILIPLPPTGRYCSLRIV